MLVVTIGKKLIKLKLLKIIITKNIKKINTISKFFMKYNKLFFLIIIKIVFFILLMIRVIIKLTIQLKTKKQEENFNNSSNIIKIRQNIKNNNIFIPNLNKKYSNNYIYRTFHYKKRFLTKVFYLIRIVIKMLSTNIVLILKII